MDETMDNGKVKPGAAYEPESVAGKSVLVTGGTTGIGRATALMLAAAGSRVMILGRHQPELDDAMNDLRAAGGEVYGIAADISTNEEIEKIFREVDQRLGGVDILVNNAALSADSIVDGSYEDWEYVVRTNLLGYMACTHEAVARMRKREGGHIVNVGSMSADVRDNGSSIYVATKAGIQGFSEALRKEVNADRIKVSLVEPGKVGTDMSDEPAEEQPKEEEALKMLKAEDIAAAIYYCLIQPKRCDVVVVQVRPHLQEI